MIKYYNAEDVIRAIEEMPNCYNGWSDTYDKAEIIGVLEELPTTNIVHCKDCKHNPKYTKDFAFGRCVCCCEDDWYGYEPEDNFFCGHGERIEE